ncbi:MAG: glycosyltransferase family 4 protein [Rhodospirillaceae bacterium]|nr:glycosyltransferase family 4 protein [Rhodospirillales bacterium]
MTESLSIALPTSTFLPGLGGAEVGLHNIALRLVERGHRPVVIVPAPHAAQLKRDDWQLPYPVVAFPPKVWGLLHRFPGVGFAVLDSFFEFLHRRHRFDFWHCTMGWPTGVALVHYARTRRPVPHLVRCAGEDIQRDASIGYGARLDPKVDALVRRWLVQADRLVAITATVAQEYQALGVPPERVAEVPNGVDLSRFAAGPERAATRAALGIAQDDFVFLSVGRNHPKKNFAAVLNAAARLKAQGRKNFRLIFAGLGTPGLAPLAAQLGLTENAVFLDQIGGALGSLPLKLPDDQLVGLYRAADCFVFPSIMETFGIVLVEAMAASLPIVTADAPGCRDIVRGGRDGLLTPPSDADALAAAMGRIMDEPGLAADLSQRSALRARDFSWDDVVSRYEGLYHQGIAARKGNETLTFAPEKP